MESGALYEGLRRLGLLYDCAAAMPYSAAEEYYGGFLWDSAWFQGLPGQLQRRYRQCVALNGMKFALAAQCFQKPWDEEAVSAAVCFLLSGCILDDLLDEGSRSERALARKKLDWEYCAHYFVRFGPAKNGHSVDMLYEVTASFLKRKRNASMDAYDCLIQHLRRAVAAETANAASVLEDEALAVDKSVLFVVIGFELALYGTHTRQEWETFFLIGDLLRIVDDLCDAEQDERAGRMNSLLLRQGLEEVQLEQALFALKSGLQRLRTLVNGSLWEFIRHEIRCWTLGNEYLFQRTMGAPLCRIL